MRRWADAGVVPCRRTTSGQRQFLPGDLERFLEKCRAGGNGHSDGATAGVALAAVSRAAARAEYPAEALQRIARALTGEPGVDRCLVMEHDGLLDSLVASRRSCGVGGDGVRRPRGRPSRRGGLAARGAAGRARDAAQRRAAARPLAPLHPLRHRSRGQRLPRPARARRRAPAGGAPGARPRPRRPRRARRPPPPGGARPGGAGSAHGLAAACRPQHDLQPGAAGRAGRRGARGGGHLRGAVLRDLGVRGGPGCPARARRLRRRPGVLRGRRDRTAG